ncbi:lasso peptide biosynthesis PqqD family chaperone [Streptomyces sp. WG7]|uniref:lasso peptide biosynthesis PqqD family chaperone n=1 Tax=Streptomyces sp. WG7 TaxID=3417650 RepID=UPI003CF73F18
MNPQLCDHVSLVHTEYGSVLLDEKSGMYFQLNETATIVAEGLADRSSLESIAQRIAQEYDVDEGQAREDVAVLVRTLRDRNLVQS